MAAYFLRVVAILLLCAAIGAAQAQLRGLPWFPDMKKVEEHAIIRQELGKQHEDMRKTLTISLDELKAALTQDVVIIDARPAEEFAKGHLLYEYDPPALNVESQDVDKNLPRLEQLRGRPWILYCTSESCEMAEELYIALKPFNFENIRIYFGGWDGIKAAGLPIATGPDVWNGYGASDESENAEIGEGSGSDEGTESP